MKSAWRVLVRRRTSVTGAIFLLALAGLSALADGAPGLRGRLGISAAGTLAETMAQGHDGNPSQGSGNGLFRFDGASLEHLEQASGDRFRSSDMAALPTLPEGLARIGLYYGIDAEAPMGTPWRSDHPDDTRALPGRPAADSETPAGGARLAQSSPPQLASATMRVTPAPWFFSSRWFYALCAVIAAALASAFIFWRMRLTSDRARLQLMERMNERERIARDIHDTLLQGAQGLLLRLQAIVAHQGPDDPHADALKAAIHQARDMVIEGRDKIIALRGDGQNYPELMVAILAVGAGLAAQYPATTFHITSEGRPRTMLASACDEILDIVREAVRNAFAHAQASRVTVHVAYRQRSLRVRIADDGSGFDKDTLQQAAHAGHWGIVGMRERAARLDAMLTLRRLSPRGSEWQLRVPCRAAYKPPRHGAA